MITNIKANDKGEIEVILPDIPHLNTIRLVAFDVMSNISVDIATSKSETKLADVRLAESKKAGLVYA